MGFGVFVYRTDSIYDDSPAEKYQFPAQYLGRARGCIGEWIIYYEPQKAIDSRGYFAVANVADIIADPAAPAMYLAVIEAGSYLPFVNSVPFRGSDGVIETGVLNDAGRISGRAQSAVRPISSKDFGRILALGLGGEANTLPRDLQPGQPDGLAEQGLAFEYEDDVKRRMTYITSRLVRDRVFRRVVLHAYNNRCAVTGLKLINGGGRAEVEAAHIRPVAENGPDIVNNGLALSGTVHWMFDRGLITVSDDLHIHLSRHINDSDSVRALINKSGKILAPNRGTDRPLPRFLEWHRTHCFKV